MPKVTPLSLLKQPVIKVKVPKLITFLCHRRSLTSVLIFTSKVTLSFKIIHSLIAGKLLCPAAVQTCTSLRSVVQISGLRKAEKEDAFIPCQRSKEYKSALDSHNVNLAFKIWTQDFEYILKQIATKDGTVVPNTAAAKRGQVILHEQRKHPRIVFQQASTLKGRKLWKAHCQAQEILKAAQGTRRNRTIHNLWSVAPWLSSAHVEAFHLSMTQADYPAVANTLKLALEANDFEDKQQRIKAWKRSLRKDLTANFQRIKQKAAIALMLTANPPPTRLTVFVALTRLEENLLVAQAK